MAPVSSGGVTAGSRPVGRILTGSRPLRDPPSIPSKYQTYVIVNNEKKGFNSKSCRFSDYDYITENPGPGSYTNKLQMMSNHQGKTSWSKKGLGSFASSTKRFKQRRSEIGVGPGSYDHSSPKTDFNRAVTSAFHKPICMEKRQEFTGPPPNQYNPVLPTRTAPSAFASFKSRTKRDALVTSTKTDFPSPGSYEVKDNVIKSTVNPMSSVFKSKVKRDLKELHLDSEVPGPGAYDPHIPTDAEATPFYRLHYLAISAPAMPLPKAKPQPGPGHYDIVNYTGPKKTQVASANFLSTLPRGTALEPYKHISPGPAAYKPNTRNKHSFIYNFKGRWI